MTVTPVDALFDTGASATCILHDVAVKLDLPVIGKREMVTATGLSTMNVYLADFVFPFGVPGKSQEGRGKDVMLTEFRSDGTTFKMFLGRDVLCQGMFQMVGMENKFMFCL
ncbi:MAG: hypothetical protein CMF63_03285 [Magnetovibrio sp.]|nr:hypothetical protein [Magnetovibrio sp.]